MSAKTNRTLAGPPGDCCFTTFRHEGTPVGTTITIAGVPTYLSEPPKIEGNTGHERIIIFFADVYGAFYQNNLLLQDFLAQNGFTVLGMDYFRGDPVYKHDNEPGFDRNQWIRNMQNAAEELVPKWWAEVKDKYGHEAKYCVVGYCFGAAYTLNLTSDDAIVAAALAHPAFIDEEHIRNTKKPLMLSCAEIDHTFPLDKRRIAEDILIERKAQYFFQIFSGIMHGFACRFDPSTPDIRWGKEQSARGVAMWFHRLLDEKFAAGGLKAKA